MGIITDGRSVTQRNKIEALGLEDTFDDIIISEEFGSSKPSEENYLYFEKKYGNSNFTYIGDNTVKDFVTPNSLGWNTLCLLDDGNNIHKQNLDLNPDYLAKKNFSSFKELIDIYE